MILAVLSDRNQYQSLLANFTKIEDVFVLCDNPSFYPFLQSNNICFEALEEGVLKDKWISINTWACEKAILWNRLTEKNLFKGVELNKALYVYFSYYLASFLKNYFFAEFIYAKYKPEKIIVFKGKHIPNFPAFNGNYFLNMFLSAKGQANKCEVVSLEIMEESTPARAVSVKEKIRNFVQKLYSKILFYKGKKEVFIMRGALKNLRPIAKSLSKQGHNVCLYGFEFRFEQFLFCLKEKMLYLVPECFMKKNNEKFGYKDDFLELINLLRTKQWFKYENTDLSDFVCAQLQDNADKYLESISLWSEGYTNMINAYDVKGLITDEDLTSKGAFMAAFLKSQSIKSFCISHGYGPIKFSLKEQDRIFFLSETFVQSEFEKDLYCSWGWDKEHVKVSGIPRYDAIKKLKSAAGSRRMSFG
ncbi:MAG: hypothetical protein WC330_07960, partial [Candidatus Omnitrophota bacterium]